MPEPRMIKSTNRVLCPHCSKEILISLRSYFPTVDWALKEEDLAVAKERLKEGIEKITFNDLNRKKEILTDIEQEGFIVSPDEIEPILKQIEKDNKETNEIKDN